MWTERLLLATGWLDQRLTLPWRELESALAVELPRDYKRLCEAFGDGVFCNAYFPLSTGADEFSGILGSWQVYLRLAPEPDSEDEGRSQYAPFAIHRPGRAGLIPWGSSESGHELFWLADERPSDEWPTLAQWPDAAPGDWVRFNISASEFLGRAILDPDFGGFGVAELVPQPFFTPFTGEEVE